MTTFFRERPTTVAPPASCTEGRESAKETAPVIDVESKPAAGRAVGAERTDALTGLHSRHSFDEWLQRELAVGEQQGNAVSLLLFSVDHLSTVNDQRGLRAGDVTLKLVAGSIRTLLRPNDMLARFAGAQFAVVSRTTSARNLEILASRVCQRVAELSVEPNLQNFAITVSAGLATMDPGGSTRSAGALRRTAQEALREAEAAGGNRVCSSRSAVNPL